MQQVSGSMRGERPFHKIDSSPMSDEIHAKCHRCGHEWPYTGKAHERSEKPRKKLYIACPRCRTSTRLFKE